MGPAAPGLAPERSQTVARQRRLVGVGIRRHYALVHPPRVIQAIGALADQTDVIQRRCRPRRLGVRGRHLLVIHERRVGVLGLEALSDVVDRVGDPLAGRVRLHQFAESGACGARASEPELAQGGLVHLLRRWRRRRSRGRGGIGCRGLRDLLAPALQLGAQLGEPTLALPSHFAELHDLLLNAVEVVLHVAAERAHRRARAPQRVEDLLLHAHDVGELARPLPVLSRLDVAHLRDLILEAPDVAPEGAAREGDEGAGECRDPHCGATRVSPPEVTSNSSRRFCAKADSSAPAATGRSSPNEMTSMREPSMPLFVRYILAAAARRLPSARLYSSEPRSSAWPLMRSRTDGLACRIAAFRSRLARSSLRMSATL